MAQSSLYSYGNGGFKMKKLVLIVSVFSILAASTSALASSCSSKGDDRKSGNAKSVVASALGAKAPVKAQPKLRPSARAT